MTDAPRSSPPRRRWLLPTIIGVALLLVGVTIGVVAASSSDDNNGSNNSSLSATQLANVQRACQQWMGSYTGNAPSQDFCSGMASWMNNQWRSGQMMGSMMWGNADRMRTACKRWAGSASSTTSSPSGTNQTDWCDSMANWMSDHANGDWGGWMMNGNGMMGN